MFNNFGNRNNGSYNQYEDDRREASKRRSLASSLFVILIAGFLGMLVIFDYCEPIDKSFSPMAYYEGKYSNEIENPKDIYNKMISAKFSTEKASDCKLEPTFIAMDDGSIYHPLSGSGDIAWPVKGATSGSFDNKDAGEMYNVDSGGNQIESSAAVKGYTHWYLWANTSNMEIVSPWPQIQFLNANVDDNSSTISVMAVGADGEDEVRWLEFHNVKNWFCHMTSAEHVTSHKTRIGKSPDEGASDTFGQMGQGFAILGMADKNTYIVGKSKKVGGSEVECSPYYVFHPEEEVAY